MRRARRWQLLGLPFFGAQPLLSACTTTPIDAIVAETGDPEDGGASSDTGVDLDACSSPELLAPGVYRLRARASQRCAGVGSPTTVFAEPAFDVELFADCGGMGRSWELVAASFPQQFQLRNRAVGYNLDVRSGATEDGTPLVLFEPHALSNQRFFLRARNDEYFEIAPASVVTRCLTEVGAEIQISACDSDEQTQDFELVPEVCD